MGKSYVPIEELAKNLSVSVSTIRGWVRNKYIPEDTYIRVVNTYRFCVDDVVAALSAAKGRPTEDTPIAGEQDKDL
jgi:DNA-binding transcriptional MerR regulator|tara:strand:+ start:2962 stop:3189 length:228 start_codon:yes stop_codon:yes gene_type:complete